MTRGADRLLLYARTARGLRARQILHRAVRMLPWGRARRQPARRGAEADPAAWSALGAFLDARSGEAALERAGAVLEGHFDFVGESRQLVEIDWRRTYGSRLWTYQLHYFDYALDLALAYRETGEARWGERFQSLAEGWMADSESAAGVAWEPYPVSLRTVNWIYAGRIFGEALDPAFAARLLDSVHAQLTWLERNLERDLMANHLLKNLKALVIGGWVFRGPDAVRWRRRFPRLLWQQVREQVLPDGVHFERSPMYHAIVLADLLEVARIARAVGATLPADVSALIRSMVEAAAWLGRPDGTLHLFHDAAQDHAPGRSAVERLARDVLGAGFPAAEGLVPLAAGGYYGVVEGAGDRLVIDAGEPGAPHQPGHAHCSLLSYELDWRGIPLVVDAGVSGYDGDPLRRYVRSTRAHNTVTVDGLEQSEIWATFRMARRAQVEDARQWVEEGGYRFRGSYRPYHDRRIRHRRLVARREWGWEIQDWVEGALGREIASFVHIHPDWRVEPAAAGFLLTRGAHAVRLEPSGFESRGVVAGALDPPQGWYCPRFGERLPAPAVRLGIARHDGRPLGYRLVPADAPV